MLCSNCGEKIKPVVALDIDGTLGDYHGHFLRFMATYLDKFLPEDRYVGSQPFSQWCAWMFGTTVEGYREVKLAYRQGGMKRSMPTFPGARGLCRAIRDAGSELWLTTTRPYLALDGVVKDTHEWMRRHGIESDGLLFDDDKYKTLAERVDPQRVVAIFDDSLEYIEAAEQTFGSEIPVLVKGSYNSSFSWPVTCDLGAVADIALHRIRQWEASWEKTCTKMS